MFRKTLATGKEAKISGKDIKKLNALLLVKFGEGTGFGARANVYLKSEASCAQLVSVKADDEESYCFGALDAKGFDRAMTAASNGERGKVSDVEAAVVFPSLHWLWKAIEENPENPTPLNVAPLHVHSNVSHFVLNGADFMAAGLQGRQFPYPEGSVVALYVIDNPKPFAIGLWQGNRSSGVAVQVLTRFGDSLWAQNPTKPEGFTPTSVLSLAEADASVPAIAPEAEGEQSNASADKEAGNEEVDCAEEEMVDAGEPVTSEKDEMDALLLKSFLQTAKTTLKAETKEGVLKVGPLAIDVFYAQYVRPARPINTSIDVHKSSHKKVSKFVDYLKTEGLISCDAKGSVTRIDHGHPDIRSFELHEVEEAADSNATSGGKKSGVSSLYVEGLASSRVEFPLHMLKPDLNKIFFNAEGECLSPHIKQRAGAPEFDLEKAFAPPPRDGSDEKAQPALNLSLLEVYVEQSMVVEALKDYGRRHDLMVSKKLLDVKRLGIPALLEDPNQAPMTVDALARRVMDTGTERKQFHKITTVSLVGEEKVSYRQGAPQRVDIRTEKRKNHNVTIIQGLDARSYGYDLAKLGDFFKKKFSVQTFLEEMGSAQFIVIGGFFDRDVENMCKGELGIPADCVQNSAAGRKADMKQKKPQ